MMMQFLLNKSFISVAFISFVSILGFSQTNEDLAKFKQKYPGEYFMQKKQEKRIVIKMVKGIPKVSHFTTSEFLVLDKNGIASLSQDQIDFSPFETVGKINAYSEIPTEKGSKKITVTNFQTSDAETEGSVFHDGNKVTSFLFPDLKEGAMCHLDYEKKVSEHFFPFGFYFFNSYPAENETFIIECDSSVHLLFKELYLDKIEVQFTEELIKNKRIYTWKAADTYKIKGEERGADMRYFAPHVIAQIAYYNTKKGRVNVLETVTDLHNYYQKSIANVIDETPNENLKSIADSLTSKLSNDFEKVKAIYYWVQNNIKYIAFEEGMGGFVPRQPNSICEKRYGDCKDMASLIYAMTKSVNINTYLTWIGSRDIPYKYTDFPSSFCDNHMIAYYPYEGKDYFLDATNSFLPMGVPNGFIQGKQALVHKGENQFEVKEVAVPAPEFTTHIDSSFVEIVDKAIEGNTIAIENGYYQTIVGGLIRDIPAAELEKYTKGFIERGNNSFKSSDLTFSNKTERDQNVQLEFDWKVQNLVTKIDNESFVNMVLTKDFTRMGELKAERNTPYELDNKFNDTYFVSLEIPEGYSVKSIPKNTTFENELLKFSVNYKIVDETIEMTLNIRVDFLVLYPEKFALWNEYVKIKKQATSESVVFTKTK